MPLGRCENLAIITRFREAADDLHSSIGLLDHQPAVEAGPAERHEVPLAARIEATHSAQVRGEEALADEFREGDLQELIAPDTAHLRTEEYALFRTSRISDWAREFDLEIVGMRGMRDELRARPA
jgi:hypothetical protein